jgi:hypothetical protein
VRPEAPFTACTGPPNAVPDLVGLPDRGANHYLQRGLLPYKLFGMQQLFRYTLPVARRVGYRRAFCA